MAYLRHAPRHVAKAVRDHIFARLDALDWRNEGSVPFGTTPVTYVQTRVEEKLASTITGNLVAVSFTDELDDEEMQLGGGLSMVQLPFFVDCVAVEEPIALSLASDVKDLLSGRVPGTSRFLAVRDYSVLATGTVLPDYRLEMTDVVREKFGGAEWRARWHIVKATAELTHPGEA